MGNRQSRKGTVTESLSNARFKNCRLLGGAAYVCSRGARLHLGESWSQEAHGSRGARLRLLPRPYWLDAWKNLGDTAPNVHEISEYMAKSLNNMGEQMIGNLLVIRAG